MRINSNRTNIISKNWIDLTIMISVYFKIINIEEILTFILFSKMNKKL